MQELRKIEVLVGNEWEVTRLHLIKKGERFRLWEGNSLVTLNDRNTFVALIDGNEDGIVISPGT